MEELKTNEQNIDPTVNNGIMTNLQWENFAKGDLINFLVGHQLLKVTVDDGAGKKATVKINSKGEYNVSYTTNEVM
jgi:hypothetical protein